MSDPNIIVDLDVSAATFASSFADFLQEKLNFVPRNVADTDIYTTAQWGNFVDNFFLKVQARLSGTVINGAEYDIAADGVTDDTAAIQDAIDDVSNLGGGTLLLPRGTMLVTSSIVLASSVNITGQGADVSMIKGDFGAPLLRSPVTSPSPLSQDRINFIVLEKFGLNGTDQTNAGSVGLDISQANYVSFRNFFITNCKTGLRRVGYAYYSDFSAGAITNCDVGILNSMGANSNSYRDLRIGGVDYGVIIEQGDAAYGTNQIMLDNIRVESAATRNIYVSTITPQGTRGVMIMNCRLEGDNTSTGIEIEDDIDQSCIINNYFSNLAVTRVINEDVFELSSGVVGNLQLRDMANPSTAMRILYESVNSRIHFCVGSGYTNYRGIVGAHLVVAGVNSYMEGARLHLNRGSALVAGNFTLSAAWGATASVTLYKCRDSVGRFYVTANGAGIAANPTITITFADGNFPAVPHVSAGREGGAQIAAPLVAFPAVNQVLFVLQTTPVAGETFGFWYEVTGA